MLHFKFIAIIFLGLISQTIATPASLPIISCASSATCADSRLSISLSDTGS
ncbi:hypothetical protein FPV67DRAFT_1665274 [Lyophyllum atratum]|nr:hypothetical protein FPV67DRAFT_1665274 [Lyophyllum atratum]